MTVKDNLEIGLKKDAPLRKDNLPDFQKTPGIPETKPGDPTRSPVDPKAIRTKGTGTKARRTAPRKPENNPEPGDPQ